LMQPPSHPLILLSQQLISQSIHPPNLHKSSHPLTQPNSSWPFYANNSIVLTVIQSFKGYVATADAAAAVDLRAPRRAPAIPGKTPPTAKGDGHGGDTN
jgi:hypothetical protein